MRTTKKILSMILAFVMVLAMLPTMVFATEPEDTLTGEVFISISDDAEYILDLNGDSMAYVAVPLEELAWIDLADYYLEDYIYDSDNDGVQDITALHLYIYVHEVLLELDWFDVQTSGDPGSIYLAGGLFGFSDENLRYDMNGDYPIDEELSQQWGYRVGATADRILLSDGDFLNIAHYTSWSFYSDSAAGFRYFANSEGELQHTYQVSAGNPLELQLLRSYSSWDGSGIEPEVGHEVYYGKAYGEPEGRVYSNEEGMMEITFPSAGVWYVWSYGACGNEAVEDIVSAPAFATVKVPDLEITLDLSEVTEPIYSSGIFYYTLEEGSETFHDDSNVIGKKSNFGFATGEYDQYILYVDFYADSSIIGWNVNGVNYFMENTDEPYQEWILDNDVWLGYAFGYPDESSGREYHEFYLQLGFDGAYSTPGSWTVAPLMLTDAVLETMIAIDDIYAQDEITLESGEAIALAGALYDALTDREKEVLDYLEMTELLEEARETYNVLLSDQVAAGEVETLIAAIGTVDLNKEAAITSARAAYDALTDTRKAMVSNYATLTAAEERLEQLKQETIDREAADAVEEQIAAIGTVTAFSDKKIKTAREAYNALTDVQKTFVENANVLTAAESALTEVYKQAAKADHKAIYEATAGYIAGLDTPAVGSTGGEWLVVDLVRAGLSCPEGYYQNVVDYVEANINSKEQLHRSKSTDNSRVILALTAAGYDVTDVAGHNLLMGLTDMIYIPKQGINGPIWALIAFDSHNYEIPVNPDATEQATREKLIAYILDKQLADGGWALSGQSADPDMTGMALQALAPYYKTNDSVKAAVDKALTCLSNKQLANGGYGSFDGVCAESCAQVVVALTALGIDPESDTRFVKNGMSVVDAMCLFAINGGGFAHIPGGDIDGMATEQGQYALVSYFRFKENKTALYDMTDVVLPGEAVAEQIAAVGTVSLDSKTAIEAVRAAYDALSAYQKTLVANYEALTAAEATLKELQTAADKDADDKDVTDKPLVGKVENTTDVKDNVCTGSLDVPATELADKLLTKEDKQQMQEGVNINIDLQIKDISKNVSASDKALVEKALDKSTVGMYLDITLTKQLGEAAPVKITETNGAVTVTIVVPENLRNTDATVNRTYQVIRVHEGKTDVLDATYDAKTGKLSFNTDAFSTYALVYTDTAVADAPDSPKTGDNMPVGLLALMMVTSAVSLAVLVLNKKKFVN